MDPENDCGFFKLSVHENTPTFGIGSVWIAAYLLPLTATITLLAITRRRNRLCSSKEPDCHDSSKAEAGESLAQDIVPWTAPNILWELLRISLVLGPIAFFWCLVGLCNSCLPWWPVVSGEPAKPPFSDAAIYLGGLAFLLTFIAGAYPRDRMRPLRTPRATLNNECWMCARAAGRALLSLLMIWGIVWVLHQMGVSVGSAMHWFITKVGEASEAFEGQ